MFFWVWTLCLLAFSALGAARTRTARIEQYARFIYVCAVWWALIPVVTGEWRWSLVFLPAGLLVARMMIRRRGAERTNADGAPPPI